MWKGVRMEDGGERDGVWTVVWTVHGVDGRWRGARLGVDGGVNGGVDGRWRGARLGGTVDGRWRGARPGVERG